VYKSIRIPRVLEAHAVGGSVKKPRTVDAQDPADRRGHLRTPDTRRGRGVVVLCEPGREELSREACARLARHGFVAFAPVLSEEEGAAITEAERAEVDAAIHALFCESATDGARVGVLGVGRGGRLALDAAARGERVGCAVMFGGAPPEPDAASSAGIECAVLAVFAEKDPAVAEGRATALEASWVAEAVAGEVQVAPGVGAEYLDPARPDHYDAVAARASWDAALARFRAEL
jgi:dienelactone hydrolase